jgi:TRAP transporter TAXI family solute receptor
MRFNKYGAALVLVSGLFLSACGGSSGSDDDLWLMGTAPTGGTFYALGAAMAEAANGDVDGLKITAQVSAGSSTENFELLNNGDIELGFIDAGTFADLAESGADFSDIRVVFNAYPSVMHWVVQGGSDIESPADFAGEKIAVGNPKSGMESNNKALLEAGWNLTFDDIEPQNLHVEPGLQALVDGNVAAANIPSSVPLSTLNEFSNTDDIRLLDLPEADVAKISEKLPFWSSYTIPGGTYEGNEEDVRTVATGSYVVARADVDEDVLRGFVEAVFEDQPQIAEAVSAGKGMTPDYATEGLDYLESIGVKTSPVVDAIPQ